MRSGPWQRLTLAAGTALKLCRQRISTIIETVFPQLEKRMHLQQLGTKTGLGLCKRVIGAMTAFTMGIYINFVLGHPLLAIKALFA